MPKETFLNLPEGKRKIIEEAAFEEFAECGFDKASTNRIVQNSGISKGSFYQYFEDKLDLFKHIIDLIGQEKLKYIAPEKLIPANNSFYDTLTEMYRSGLAFARANPRAARIANDAFKNQDHSIYGEIFRENKEVALGFYDQFLDVGIARGDIRADIDKKFIAFTLMSLNVTIFEYYFSEVKGSNFNITAVDDDVMETINSFMDFIRSGLCVQVKEKK